MTKNKKAIKIFSREFDYCDLSSKICVQQIAVVFCLRSKFHNISVVIG